ncbi:hypothetical protein GGS24DRAFT_501436 [Hypoxylon argillaceum]|nr:hypothetical protein GGS24DRAFT_501436 [Hypoxylon argillaceum]
MEVQLGPTTNNVVDSPITAANARYHHPYDLHHRHLAQQASVQQNNYYGYPMPTPKMSKRKAESQDNERLSKRLSILNLERNGPKLYVPVEGPSLEPLTEHPGETKPTQSSPSPAATPASDSMQLDNTKHKVYIYDLDAELSSADETSEEGECPSSPGSPTSGRGRLVVMPDFKKHLRRARIPPAVFANGDGELAGHNINDMQMVLYSEPTSLTVPREQDSVRKAIIEARARARQRQLDRQGGIEQEPRQPSMGVPVGPSPVAGVPTFGRADGVNVAMDGFSGHDATPTAQSLTPWRATPVEDDPDAMDID